MERRIHVRFGRLNRMPEFVLAGAVLWVCFFVVSCVTVGNKFSHVSIPQLKLGVTTKSDAIASLGKPNAMQTVSNDDGEFEVLKYGYVDMGLLLGSVQGIRAMTLTFYLPPGGKEQIPVLDSYLFISTFLDDQRTESILQNVSKIRKGVSDKNQVLSLLEMPNGKSRYHSLASVPLSKADLLTREVWIWTAQEGEMDITVEIGFDEDWKVTSVSKSKQTYN